MRTPFLASRQTRVPRLALLAVAGVLSAAAPVRAAPRALAFAGPDDLKAWQVAGEAVIDPQGPEGRAALKLGANGSAAFSCAEGDGSGTVSIRVYDDLAAPADPKQRRLGPRWGLKQADGHVLGIGLLYAPYLSGSTTYCTTEYDGQTWFIVQYLGESRRTKGWHTWTFAMDADKGLSIQCDGKDVNAARPRFDWNKTRLAGFNQVVLFGDTGAAPTQPLWVERVEVSVAGPMKARPAPPPPPAPVVPAQDPALTNALPALRGTVMKAHPRLLFGPDDVPALRTFAQSPAGKPFLDALLAYLPSSKTLPTDKFLTDATDGQRVGLWRLPTVALHALLFDDASSREAVIAQLRFLLACPHWESGAELDSGMSAANVMIGAALAYDWLYDRLDPELREAFRRKLLLQARAMYHGGHLNGNHAIGYWQNDTHNNHRWHRDAGLALAVLAAYSGAADEGWILSRTREELDFVAQWLPPDGSSHESPTYLIFGGPHLTLAMQAADRCFGTDYLQQPFFKHVAEFRVQMLTPGLANGFQYGDSAGVGGYNAFAYKPAAVHRQADVQAALDRLRTNVTDAFQFGWWLLLWYDPSLTGGAVANLPRTVLFPDNGIAVVRDGWEAKNAAALFKCGPLGGHTLNRFRNERGGAYINVAHDDPDANSFTLFARGGFLAETDRYSSKSKRTDHFNTILVNGIGQTVAGRAEGGGWSQPATGNTDMSQMAYVTGWKDASDIVIVEGEAAGAYPAIAKGRVATRPALARYRRAFIWVAGAYVLVLDDIRAPQPVELTWLLQGPRLTADAAVAGRFTLARESETCAVVVRADAPYQAALRASPADNRGQPLGWQQLQATLKTPAVRFASVYALWGGAPELTLDTAAADAVVRVRREGGEDVWTWTPAPDATTPATLRVRSANGRELTFGPADRAPAP